MTSLSLSRLHVYARCNITTGLVTGLAHDAHVLLYSVVNVASSLKVNRFSNSDYSGQTLQW